MLIYNNTKKFPDLFPSFPYCLFPIAYSLLPIPYCLKSTTCVPHMTGIKAELLALLGVKSGVYSNWES
ncbi:MAG: hypothetical protein F6J90_17175 [Moorea sp. SIOASIH]|uniref:hypothetical protein n=1 Tax=Moorena sp. SIOASIH TaxID=2607817 RepID=UPI0013BC89E7|nr:hypothetical protein [Moorena sp. SIOASIH]NEO37968.1 hypothetical protein [Moorena sp. SIOASIH]